MAALHGKCNLLRKLLEKPGVDVNATAEYKTKDGEAVQTTSLLAAVRNSQQEAVELLLDRPWRRMMISRLLRRMTMTLKTSESTSEMGLSCARQCKSGWATHLHLSLRWSLSQRWSLSLGVVACRALESTASTGNLGFGDADCTQLCKYMR